MSKNIIYAITEHSEEWNTNSEEVSHSVLHHTWFVYLIAISENVLFVEILIHLHNFVCKHILFK